MDDESISSSDRAEKWFERTRFCSAFFSLSEATGLGGTWGLLEGVERLGCKNPSTSARTSSTLTLVGEHLDYDDSALEVTVFKGPAEPLGALLEGAAELLGIGGTPRGRFGGIGWTPIRIWRTLSGLARNPGVGRYRPRLPGRSLSAGRYRSGSARRTHVRFSRPEWTIWKHPG